MTTGWRHPQAWWTPMRRAKIAQQAHLKSAERYQNSSGTVFAASLYQSRQCNGRKADGIALRHISEQPLRRPGLLQSRPWQDPWTSAFEAAAPSV